MNRRLHPLPLAAGIVVALLTILLGNWQVRRAAEKSELQTRIEAGASGTAVEPDASADLPEWRSVALHGEWQPAGTIYLDNRVYAGRAGYHVLTPLRLDDGAGIVLVNRGWIAAGGDRAQLPEVVPPAGRVTLAGTVRHPELKPFTLAREAAQGRLWQFIDIDRYRTWSGLAVRDWVAQQTSASPDGLVRDWPRPDAGIERHRGYALQWYSLAGLALVLTGAYVFRGSRS
jgi:surfeit locus 1 family protein